jgi:hypothetical protein
MDDYNISAISEAKNEYSARLANIITPLIIEGIKSIFKEAIELCIVNDEKEKYLMTFQNFLTRVPKWNQSIIDSETERIIKKSKCNYLDDLISCVHISQLKILTSIRVSNKQKKVDIEIPKVNAFIHNIYIKFARKLYSNVYLFETTISPLQVQKNNRECELICKECILNVIRENIPVDKILRAYIDKTEEEEEVIIETKLKETVDTGNKVDLNNDVKDDVNNEANNDLTINNMETIKQNIEVDENKIENKTPGDIVIKKVEHESKLNLIKSAPSIINTISENITKENFLTKFIGNKSSQPLVEESIDTSKKPILPIKTNKISFSENDFVKEYNVTSSPRSSSSSPVSEILAPKNIKRLEEISTIRNEARKEEEDDGEKLTIFSNDPSPLKLDALEIETLPELPKTSDSPSLKSPINLKKDVLDIQTLK